jgi:hypothetical protein
MTGFCSVVFGDTVHYPAREEDGFANFGLAFEEERAFFLVVDGYASVIRRPDTFSAKPSL